jgi:hypothetical protein
MVKKSIIAIALMSMLATVSFAQSTQVPGQFKIDGKWPVTCVYTPIEICRIPVVLEVGMFIEIENCSTKKIVLKQVSCPSGQSFPCYKGCVEIKVRANFEAQLGLKLYKVGSVITNWKAYFTIDGGVTQASTWIVTGDGNWNTVSVCVEAWDANIYAAAPGTQVAVGEVGVTAMPTGTPVCP